ncbi:MAG: hypothetical protein ACK516_08105 [Cyanobium sp.]
MPTFTAAITLVALLAAIVVFFGGWLAPESAALSATGLLIAGECSPPARRWPALAARP